MFEIKVTISADAQLAALLAAIVAALGGTVPATLTTPTTVQETPVKKMPPKEKTPAPEKIEEGEAAPEPAATAKVIDVSEFNMRVTQWINTNPAARKPILAEIFTNIGVKSLSKVPPESRAEVLAKLEKVA